jgi:hypothetical protein
LSWLAWLDVGLLIDLSSASSHRSVIFLSDRVRQTGELPVAGDLREDLSVTQGDHA